MFFLNSEFFSSLLTCSHFDRRVECGNDILLRYDPSLDVYVISAKHNELWVNSISLKVVSIHRHFGELVYQISGLESGTPEMLGSQINGQCIYNFCHYGGRFIPVKG